MRVLTYLPVAAFVL